MPDIALEVVVTSGGINKLEVYRGLGVREVWYWHQGSFEMYRLGASGYELQERSGFLEGLDFGELAGYVEEQDQHAALKAYQEALRDREAL